MCQFNDLPDLTEDEESLLVEMSDSDQELAELLLWAGDSCPLPTSGEKHRFAEQNIASALAKGIIEFWRFKYHRLPLRKDGYDLELIERKLLGTDLAFKHLRNPLNWQQQSSDDKFVNRYAFAPSKSGERCLDRIFAKYQKTNEK